MNKNKQISKEKKKKRCNSKCQEQLPAHLRKKPQHQQPGFKLPFHCRTFSEKHHLAKIMLLNANPVTRQDHPGFCLTSAFFELKVLVSRGINSPRDLRWNTLALTIKSDGEQMGARTTFKQPCLWAATSSCPKFTEILILPECLAMYR